MADQVVSSATNFLTAFLASYLLPPDEFGRFVVAYAVVTVLMAAGRAYIGEPLLAHLAVVPRHLEDATLRSALGSAVLLGVGGGLLCLAVGATRVAGLADLVLLAPWVPVAIVQDACRYSFLSRSRTGSTLTIDAMWAVGQGLALGVVAMSGAWSVGSISATWGVGAASAVVAAVILTGGHLRPAGPRRWLRESRYLSGWFTLTSVLGQAEIYAVLIIAGLILMPAEAAGLRAIQLLIYQPAVTLMGAVLVIATPVVARAAVGNDAAGVRAARRSALLCAAGLSILILLVVLLRGPLIALFFPQYAQFGYLVLPVALQTAITAFSVPYVALLRGYRRARTVFFFQTVNVVCLIGGATLGMVFGGLRGLAWALAAESLVTVGGPAWLARRLPEPLSVEQTGSLGPASAVSGGTEFA